RALARDLDSVPTRRSSDLARRRKPHSEIGGARRGNPSRPADAGPCKRTSRWWIDRSGTGDTPRNPVANRPRLCLELPPRKPSWPAVMCDRPHRPGIWMQANRSENPPARLEGQGPSTYGLLRRCAPRNDGGESPSSSVVRQILHRVAALRDEHGAVEAHEDGAVGLLADGADLHDALGRPRGG